MSRWLLSRRRAAHASNGQQPSLSQHLSRLLHVNRRRDNGPGYIYCLRTRDTRKYQRGGMVWNEGVQGTVKAIDCEQGIIAIADARRQTGRYTLRRSRDVSKYRGSSPPPPAPARPSFAVVAAARAEI